MLGATDVDSAPHARAGNIETADSEGNRDAGTGRFLPGNRAWAARSTSAGPAPKFADGEALWAACVEYFCWVEDNPVFEMQPVTYRGLATHVRVAKMRSMTKGGLCLFLGIERSTWNNWKKDRKDLADALEEVASVIYTWQFTGAAAGLLDEKMVIAQLRIGRKVEQAGTR
jgi:DNA-packaging protein gp3